MYTSCGWFFNDLAGIEPKQNIMYAVQALNCYRENLNESEVKEFYRILSKAKSNRRHDGSGRSIALTCDKMVSGAVEATTYFILNRTFAQQKDRHHTYGKFALTMITVCDNDPFCFSLHFSDTRTLIHYYVKAFIHIPKDRRGYTMDISIRHSEEEEEITEHYDDSYLPLELIEEAYSWIDASMSTMSDEEMLRVARTIKYYTLLIQGKKNVASHTLFIESMGTSLSALRSLFTTPQTIPWSEKRESISDILRFIRLTGREMEHQTVVSIFSQEIERISRKIDTFGFNYERGSYLLDVIRVARGQEYHADITIAQESLREIIKGDGVHDFSTPLTRELIDELRKELNFSPV